MKYTRSWKLSDIYSGIESPEFIGDMQAITPEIDRLKAAAANLPELSATSDSATIGAWENQLRDMTSLGNSLSQLMVFVNCLASADTDNTEYRRLLGDLGALGAKASEIGIQIKAAMREADREDLQGLLSASSYLESIAFTLEEMFDESRKMMEPQMETLAARLSVDGIQAWGRFYTRLSGDVRIPVMEKGEIRELSQGQLQPDHPSRQVRENQHYSSIKAWRAVADHCADALNHISGTRLTLYKEQGYGHFLDKPLEDNRLQRESLDAMWQAVEDRKSILKPYMDYKAQSMGQEQLAWFDQTAPLAEGSISFDDAMDAVIQQFGAFNPEMGDFARDCIEKGYIESENRSGKRPGAYCTRFRGKGEPRVYMTFNDSHGSLRTLAHELGHAWHGHVLRNQPYELQSYVMSTAETASTFAEEIINDYLIEHAPDNATKLGMLDNSIKTAMVMMMNIHARYIFESEVYEQRSKGEIPAARLSEMMVDAQKKAFVDSLSCYDPTFWASKLHFYISGLSFYNFPYTFGYLFSNALYAIGKEQGSGFSDTYNSILVSTGCMSTEDVIGKNLGMDIRDTKFWNTSLDLIEAKVHKFIKIANVM